MAKKKVEELQEEEVETTQDEVVENTEINDFKSKAIARAKKLRRVIVTSRDPRDSGEVADFYASVDNDYVKFGCFIPLNVEVEIPQALCDTIEEIEFVLFTNTTLTMGDKAQKTYRSVKKYNVQYIR